MELLETESKISGRSFRSNRELGRRRRSGIAHRRGVTSGIGEEEPKRGIVCHLWLVVGEEQPERRASRTRWLDIVEQQPQRRWLGRNHPHPSARLPARRAHSTSTTVEIHTTIAFAETIVMFSPDQTHETGKHAGQLTRILPQPEPGT